MRNISTFIAILFVAVMVAFSPVTVEAGGAGGTSTVEQACASSCHASSFAEVGTVFGFSVENKVDQVAIAVAAGSPLRLQSYLKVYAEETAIYNIRLFAKSTYLRI
jgi:hypothetical protein